MREIYLDRVAVEDGVVLFDLTVDGTPLLRRRPLPEALERISCLTSAESQSTKEAATCLN